MRIDISKILLFVAFSFFCTSAFAHHPKKHPHRKPLAKCCLCENHWFVGAGAGAGWVGLNQTTSVNNGSFATPPSNVDKYTIHNFTSNNAQFMFGYRWQRPKTFIPYSQLYLQYRHYFSENIEGKVNQYSLPGFVNYKYKTKYSADLVTLTAKFDLFQWKKILPYVSAGTGFILNNLGTYHETATPNVTPRINPAYSGNNKAAWANTLGAGFDCLFSKNVWATFGYEHVFQTHLTTGAGAGSWSQTKLNFGNAKMDSVFLTLSATLPRT